MMTKNQIMAKVLFSNNLVSERQIQEYWGKIDASHDLGELLLEAGILDQQTYAAVSQYVQDLEVKLKAAEEAKTQLGEANAKIDELEAQIEELKNAKSGGCSGSVITASSILGAITLVGAGLALKKKKEEK